MWDVGGQKEWDVGGQNEWDARKSGMWDVRCKNSGILTIMSKICGKCCDSAQFFPRYAGIYKSDMIHVIYDILDVPILKKKWLFLTEVYIPFFVSALTRDLRHMPNSTIRVTTMSNHICRKVAQHGDFPVLQYPEFSVPRRFPLFDFLKELALFE